MTQQQIIPTTPNDFGTLELKIGIDQDEFCPYCDGQLETSSDGIFIAGIFYICKNCGKKYKKTNYLDMTKGGGYFQLAPIE